MKLEEVYIKVKDKSEVETIKNILELLGEEIYSGDFYSGYEKQIGLNASGAWWCSNGYDDNNTHKEVTIQDVILMLSKKPKFVMTSEDGVPLYVDDKFYSVVRSTENTPWYYENHWNLKPNSMIVTDDKNLRKAFSTKEAAEVWIKEQNKPNHVTIQLFHGFNCQIYKDGDIFIKNMTLKPSDLEDMLHAYKSLQS